MSIGTLYVIESYGKLDTNIPIVHVPAARYLVWYVKSQGYPQLHNMVPMMVYETIRMSHSWFIMND